MKYITAGREPFAPFQYFEEISAIPRGSYNEEAIADYLVRFAEDQGLWWQRDQHHNVVIKKPGSKGCGHLPPVILQSHSDMVCEKNKDVDHDFEKDPLDLYIEGDILRARGTTLGADNGIGVAYTLAVLADKNAVHPPLECVFTSLEEVGLIGALHLDPSLFEARRMINLDSCPEGGLLISSAGGQGVLVELPVGSVPLPEGGKVLAVRVRGLIGGHSGADIEKERANSNKLMGRILARLQKQGVRFAVCDISGGAMHNAIPRECDAVLWVKEGCADSLKQTVAAVEAEVRSEYADSDPGIRFVVEDAAAETAFDEDTTAKLVNLLHLLPSGRVSMSIPIPDLVTLSLNQGVVAVADGKVVITYSLRSAKKSALDEQTDVLIQLATILGANCTIQSGYPTWEYKPDSPLRETMKQVYKELRGKDATIQAVHGGVECAVFAEWFPDMDIVSIGPDVDNVHTPEEWLDLASFGRTYEYLSAVLARLTGEK